MATYYVGQTLTMRFRLLKVDPVSGAKTPESDADGVEITWRNPDGSVLDSLTLGAGVTNAGDGYYHGSATPTQEGMNEVAIETESGDSGRERLEFYVSDF